MSDQVGADIGADSVVTIPALPPAVEEPAFSVSEAARALAAARKPKQAVAEAAEEAPEQPDELTDEVNAAPPEEATSETQESDPAEELPPLDLPRSWTKDQTEHWSKLDRATQEFLLEHDRKASETVRRSQNEAAEQRKAVQAEREQAAKARQEYETKLPALVQTLDAINQANFGDIRSMADVEKLQAEDPFRFQVWQLHQMKISAARQEAQEAETRQKQEKATQAQERKQREHGLLLEKVPEFADAKKLAAAQSAAVEYLRDKGFTDSDLNELAANPLVDDHRFQMLIIDGLKYRDVQKAKTAVAAKPVPPVQRPGVARPVGAAAAESIQALTAKLDRTGDPRDALALLVAQRNARRAS